MLQNARILTRVLAGCSSPLLFGRDSDGLSVVESFSFEVCSLWKEISATVSLRPTTSIYCLSRYRHRYQYLLLSVVFVGPLVRSFVLRLCVREHVGVEYLGKGWR